MHGVRYVVSSHESPAITAEVIARAYNQGQLLLMATTHLDAHQDVMWNMTQSLPAAIRTR
jgi:hypothetical protein